MLGIDVAKDSLVCTLLDPATRRTLWEKSVPNTSAGVQRLLSATPGDTAWVLEPTGRYSVPVVKQARAAQRCVLLAPPRQAKNFLRSVQSRAKTDRLDSRGLALFALSQPLASFPLKSETVERLEQLLAARKGLAQAIVSLGQQRAELPHANDALSQAVEALLAQQKALDKQIAALSASAPELAATTALQKVPGIGPVTAAAVAARLSGDRFSHPDKFVAYVGLDIGVVQSGKRKGERGLTKQGDAELRRLLYLCAKSSLRAKNSPFKDQYEREKTKGLSNKAALCAVARKMAKVCWSIVHHGSAYDPSRVYQQPQNHQSP
jgi:transposase